MKLYVKEVNHCEECPHYEPHLLADQCGFIHKSIESYYDNENDAFNIPEWCPLEDVIK